MGDHLILDVNQSVQPVGGENIKTIKEMVGPSSCTELTRAMDENGPLDDEEAPLLTTAECRICQEEDSVDTLETPCSCNGSLKVIHLIIFFLFFFFKFTIFITFDVFAVCS